MFLVNGITFTSQRLSYTLGALSLRYDGHDMFILICESEE